MRWTHVVNQKCRTFIIIVIPHLLVSIRDLVYVVYIRGWYLWSLIRGQSLLQGGFYQGMVSIKGWSLLFLLGGGLCGLDQRWSMCSLLGGGLCSLYWGMVSIRGKSRIFIRGGLLLGSGLWCLYQGDGLYVSIRGLSVVFIRGGLWGLYQGMVYGLHQGRSLQEERPNLI